MAFLVWLQRAREPLREERRVRRGQEMGRRTSRSKGHMHQSHTAGLMFQSIKGETNCDSSILTYSLEILFNSNHNVMIITDSPTYLHIYYLLLDHGLQRDAGDAEQAFRF